MTYKVRLTHLWARRSRSPREARAAWSPIGPRGALRRERGQGRKGPSLSASGLLKELRLLFIRSPRPTGPRVLGQRRGPSELDEAQPQAQGSDEASLPLGLQTSTQTLRGGHKTPLDPLLQSPPQSLCPLRPPKLPGSFPSSKNPEETWRRVLGALSGLHTHPLALCSGTARRPLGARSTDPALSKESR